VELSSRDKKKGGRRELEKGKGGGGKVRRGKISIVHLAGPKHSATEKKQRGGVRKKKGEEKSTSREQGRESPRPSVWAVKSCFLAVREGKGKRVKEGGGGEGSDSRETAEPGPLTPICVIVFFLEGEGEGGEDYRKESEIPSLPPPTICEGSHPKNAPTQRE